MFVEGKFNVSSMLSPSKTPKKPDGYGLKIGADPQFLHSFNITLSETNTARERKRLEDKFPFQKDFLARARVNLRS